MNWQPIETAPKDGSEILASVLYQTIRQSKSLRVTYLAYWITDIKEYPEGVWAFDHETPIPCGTPTHWMEVPRYVEPTEELKEPPQPGTITLSGPGAKRWKEIYQMSPPPDGVELS